MCIYIYISLSLSQHAYYIVIMIGWCLLLRPLLRTVCSETAASARWSRYPAEQHKITSCYIYTEKATSSWSLSVAEATVLSKLRWHRLFGCDAIISDVLSCHFSAQHVKAFRCDVMFAGSKRSCHVVCCLCLHAFEVCCYVSWPLCHCCLTACCQMSLLHTAC